MKKILLVSVTLLVSGVVFAEGKVDVSAISQQDIARLEKIVEALEPVYAIRTALASYGNRSYPIYDYLGVQGARINLIFNEYGLVFDKWSTYQVPNNPRLNVLLAKLKSRYSYLDNGSINLSGADVLRKTLDLLQ